MNHTLIHPCDEYSKANEISSCQLIETELKLLEGKSKQKGHNIWLIGNKFAVFKKIKIAKILTIVKIFLMCNIVNTFYISYKILSNNYIYDIKWKLQLTNWCGNSCNTITKNS